MGRRKKKFIDKKKADTFRIVYRSHRDPSFGEANVSDRVLEYVPPSNIDNAGELIEERENYWKNKVYDDDDDEGYGEYDDDNDEEFLNNLKNNNNNNEDNFMERNPTKDIEEVKKELLDPNKEDVVTEYDEYMFPDDGYDYSQHLRPAGGGVFIPAIFDELPEEMFGLPPLEEDDELIHPQVFGNEEKFLDREILDILDGKQEVQDDLPDDFLWVADQSDDEEYDDYYEDNNNNNQKEDYYYAGVLENGDLGPSQRGYHPDDKVTYDRLIPKIQKVTYQINENNELYRLEPKKEDDKTVLDHQLDQMIKEFDDCEIGELDEDDPRLQGLATIDDFEYLLDEFIEKDKENNQTYLEFVEQLDEEKRAKEKLEEKLPKENSNNNNNSKEEIEEIVLTDEQKKSIGINNNNEDKEKLTEEEEIEEELEEEEISLEVDEEDRVEDDINVAYFQYVKPSYAKKDDWDCVSIMSTHSTLENHPILIDEPKKKKSLNAKIVLNRKGLPSEYIKKDINVRKVEDEEEEEEDEEEMIEYVNKGKARNKKETKEEKKQRKLALKEEKKKRREQKKALKNRYKIEKIKQSKSVVQSKKANPAGLKL
eukprot:TRINITY_DN334_c4_g1_i1.p1 TRINITY_DN334_c4_g1~~TRINITY_DN334_c4_g1_i1.p1  ORF type:complete len:608 (+),score=326.65 TRINITY_DN334_c4_g1_i1:41-1825(+)